MNEPHYAEGRQFEPIYVIQDWDLNFNLGNVVKYISRAGRKDGSSKLSDLKKALDYLQYEVDRLKTKEAIEYFNSVEVKEGTK